MNYKASILFPIVILLTVLSLAGTSGYFTVYGLSTIFPAIFWSVIIMGASLEIGKLVSVSFLYQYWYIPNKLLKFILMTLLSLLMVICMTGHFGYLSSGYLKDAYVLQSSDTEITLLTAEQTSLAKRKQEIDDQISNLPNDYVTARKRLMAEFAPELDRINKRLPELTKEIQEKSLTKITQESHTGTIVYIAKALKISTDEATKFLVLLFVIVFDPLAIALTVAANVAMREYRRLKSEQTIVKKTAIKGFDGEDIDETKLDIEHVKKVEPINNDTLLTDEYPYDDDEDDLESDVEAEKPLTTKDDEALIKSLLSELTTLEAIESPSESDIKTKEEIKRILRLKLP